MDEKAYREAVEKARLEEEEKWKEELKSNSYKDPLGSWTVSEEPSYIQQRSDEIKKIEEQKGLFDTIENLF